METRKVSVLLKAIELGSLSKTAELLDYSQSALVHMMKSLEHEVGVPLLNRTHSGVSLSKEGQALEPMFREIVRLDRDMQKLIEQMSGDSANTVRVISLPTIAINYLPDALSYLQKSHPELEIDIAIGQLDLHKAVENGDADLGFTEKTSAGSNEFMPLTEDEFMAVVPADSPLADKESITVEELCRFPVLIPYSNGKNPLLNAIQSMASHQTSVNASGGTVVLNMVSGKIGVSILSSLYQSICPQDVRMIPIESGYRRTLGIIARSFRDLTPAQKQVVSYFKKHA